MRICSKCKKSFGEQDFRVCPFDGAALIEETIPAADPMLGRILDERFRIVEVIGKGGMGAVYKAVHTQMDRVCAIKLLSPVSNDKDAAIARFRREAKMSSRIDSPNAVTIYDFGEAEPGLLYLVMEYIEGESLADLLTRKRFLPIERVVSITNQIARALAAAHELGIIHRDLKPANIMLTSKNGVRDVVKVLDFGIAKSLTDGSDDNLTQVGMLLGTPTYMSPEQVLGDLVDSRTDIYSLSIIVYQMLSGGLPFEGNNLQMLMMNRVNSEPKPLRAKVPSISEAIELVVMSGLSREPAMRIADVQQFAAALSAAARAGVVSMDEFRTLIRNHDGTFGSSTADEETQTVSTSPAENREPPESSVTLVSPPRIEINVPIKDHIPEAKPASGNGASQQHVPATPSPPSGTRRSPVIPIIVIASVLIVVTILGTGGYYVYQQSKAIAPNASPQPSSQTSESNIGGNTSPALTDSKRTAEGHYAYGKLRQQQAALYTESGSVEKAAAKNEEAIGEYRKAVQSRPNFPEARENLGVALYDLGRTAEAATEFEIAIKQYENPTAQVWTNYGMALIGIKKFHEAADAFAKALVLKPTDADLYYYRGFALHYAGDRHSSREAFGEYLKIAPQGDHARDVKAILAGRATPSIDIETSQKRMGAQ